MIWLHATCDLSFTVANPSPMILMLRPRSGPGQWIAQEIYEIHPTLPVIEHTDFYGNLCQRLVAPPGEMSIRTHAIAMTSENSDVQPGAPFTPVELLPVEILQYLLPSRYCESDRILDAACKATANALPGYDQVAAISAFVNRTVKYLPGSSQTLVSATEVANRGHGVCRDLAHLCIAMCRSLSIPARLVVGFLHGLKPMDMHAWFEAFVAGRWFTFDATQQNTQGARLAVAYGRDAGDVAIVNQFGPPLPGCVFRFNVEKIEEPSWDHPLKRSV